MGGRLPTGPRLRALAGEGAVFTSAVSTAPWTTPSMMSVMTGLYPWSHHVRDHNFTLSTKTALLAERLRDAGYATAAIVPSATLREDYGFARGFDFYSNGRYGHDVVTSPAMTSQALGWLETHKAGPFFLWIHFWDPHYNYLPPEPFNSRFPVDFRPPPGKGYDLTALKNTEWAVGPDEAAYLRGQYRGELLYTDRYLGEILDYLDSAGLRERAIVAVLGDHGEAFQEHGWLTHTVRVHEEMIRVPLLIRWPGRIAPGRRFDRAVSLVHVAPTLLDLAGVAFDGTTMEGRSLRSVLEGAGESGPDAPVVSETIRMAALASWRQGDLKYILDLDTCAGELFDLAVDPGETRDLSREQPERARPLRAALLEFYRSRPLASRTPVVAIEEKDPADAALLRSLGYVAGDRFGDVVTFAGRTDPSHCSEQAP